MFKNNLLYISVKNINKMFMNYSSLDRRQELFRFDLDEDSMKNSMQKYNRRLSTDFSEHNNKRVHTNNHPQYLNHNYEYQNTKPRAVHSLSAKPYLELQKYSRRLDKNSKIQSGKIRKNKLNLEQTSSKYHKTQQREILGNYSNCNSLYENSLCNRAITQSNETKYNPTILQILTKYQYPLIKKNKPHAFFNHNIPSKNIKDQKENRYTSKYENYNEVTHHNEKKRLAYLRDISQLQLKIKMRMASLY